MRLEHVMLHQLKPCGPEPKSLESFTSEATLCEERVEDEPDEELLARIEKIEHELEAA